MNGVFMQSELRENLLDEYKEEKKDTGDYYSIIINDPPTPTNHSGDEIDETKTFDEKALVTSVVSQISQNESKQIFPPSAADLPYFIKNLNLRQQKDLAKNFPAYFEIHPWCFWSETNFPKGSDCIKNFESVPTGTFEGVVAPFLDLKDKVNLAMVSPNVRCQLIIGLYSGNSYKDCQRLKKEENIKIMEEARTTLEEMIALKILSRQKRLVCSVVLCLLVGMMLGGAGVITTALQSEIKMPSRILIAGGVGVGTCAFITLFLCIDSARRREKVERLQLRSFEHSYPEQYKAILAALKIVNSDNPLLTLLQVRSALWQSIPDSPLDHELLGISVLQSL
ncbi:hypothetical protein [Coxiella burnetii]|uniref:hypothetical protein n=1 Tax=Coxiella burnetii TaxID=777 RepID=UPI00069504ED|nr:hypothetical protein [Coxiella burnetii]